MTGTITASAIVLAERTYTRKRWGDEFDAYNRPQDWYAYALKELIMQRDENDKEVFLMPDRKFDLPYMLALQRTAATVLSDIEARTPKPKRPGEDLCREILMQADESRIGGSRLKVGKNDVNSWISAAATWLTHAYTNNSGGQSPLVLSKLLEAMETAERQNPGLFAQAMQVTQRRLVTAEQPAEVKAALAAKPA